MQQCIFACRPRTDCKDDFRIRYPGPRDELLGSERDGFISRATQKSKPVIRQRYLKTDTESKVICENEVFTGKSFCFTGLKNNNILSRSKLLFIAL